MKLWIKYRNKIFPYLWLSPMLILMFVLVIYPIAVTFTYSLKKMKLTDPAGIQWVGFQNYIDLLSADAFWYSLQNTLILLVGVTILSIIGGLLLSFILNRETRFSGILMALAILPWALPPYVNGIMWRFIFHSDYGFMNKLLINLQLTDMPVHWFGNRWLILLVVILVAAWRSIPFCGVVLLAGLKAMPEHVRASARMDGAGTWGMLRYISLPLVMPFMVIGIVHTSIAAINIFDEIVALTGFSDRAANLLIMDYLTTFSFLDFGKGSALTYIIMLLSAVFGYIYLKQLYKEG